MAILRGMEFEHQSAVANRPHKLGHATARAAANDTLFEVMNGDPDDTTKRKFVVDLNGKLYSAALTAGDLLYAVTGGVSSVKRLDALAIGAAYQGLRVNAGATAPEWAYAPRRLTTDTTSTSTSGTGEDDLISYSFPANTLISNGQAARFTVWGSMSLVNDQGLLRFYVGSESLTVLDLTAAAAAPRAYTGAWKVVLTLVRTAVGAGLLSALAAAHIDALNTYKPPENGAEQRTVNPGGSGFGGALTIKCTGQCVNAADSITQLGLLTEFCG